MNIDYNQALHILKPFTKKDYSKARRQFLVTFISLWSSVFLSYFVFNNYSLALIILIPITTIFMCRSYVIEHDCGHLSFCRKKSWNNIIGNLVGFGILIPFSMWKFTHNSHHKYTGNIDKRHLNPEIWTMTVKEYKAASSVKRMLYRAIRSKLVRFAIIPTLSFAIAFRLIHPKYNLAAKISVFVHNIIYIMIFIYLINTIGFISIFFAFIIPLILFYEVAAFSIYGQHQFEHAYWEKESDYNFQEATFKGATCITAPKWFRWITGNAMYHNIHHMAVAIPNYNLHEAQQRLLSKVSFKVINMSEIWRLMDYKLWDEGQKKLVKFKCVDDE
jgi:omega-6 fatty acid desaturase (delta-12 desaturase)